MAEKAKKTLKEKKPVTAKKTVKAKKEAKGAAQATASDFALLQRPVVTEKSSTVNAGEGRSCVVFEVHPKASKTDIRQAIQRIFGVTVQSVRTCNNPGKLKARGRSVGRTSDYRKAYVTLAPGQTIDVVEGL